jgi:hypothetical protein
VVTLLGIGNDTFLRVTIGCVLLEKATGNRLVKATITSIE